MRRRSPLSRGVPQGRGGWGRAAWIVLAACSALVLHAEPRAARAPDGGALFYEGYTFRDNTEAVNNPHILGPMFQLYWSEIETQPGKFDWSEWDRRLAPWLKAGKKFALRIMWCSSGNWPHPASKTPTPQWVWKDYKAK